jgi:hypothetical protein
MQGVWWVGGGREWLLLLVGMAVVADWGKLGRIVVAVRAGGGEGFAGRHLGHLL